MDLIVSAKNKCVIILWVTKEIVLLRLKISIKQKKGNLKIYL